MKYWILKRCRKYFEWFSCILGNDADDIILQGLLGPKKEATKQQPATNNNSYSIQQPKQQKKQSYTFNGKC